MTVQINMIDHGIKNMTKTINRLGHVKQQHDRTHQLASSCKNTMTAHINKPSHVSKTRQYTISIHSLIKKHTQHDRTDQYTSSR